VDEWPRTEKEALDAQDALRARVRPGPGPAAPGTVAGLDVAYQGDRLAAAVVVLTACSLTLRLTPRYRLPETTRAADRACRDAVAAL
jgi:deoxyribonuclease V